MSKQLILVRHGNANSGTHTGFDFDRRLSDIGINEAQEVAFRFKNRKIIPSLLVSSPAMRAISTARIFAGILGISQEKIIEKDSIYESSITLLLRIINNLSEQIDSAAVFGHNPELTAFTEYLANESIFQLPTCGVVVIDFEVDTWDQISNNTGTMLMFDYPGADTAL